MTWCPIIIPDFGGAADSAARASATALLVRWSASVPHDIGLKVRDAIHLVERDGWALVNVEGSHRQYNHPVKKGRVTIAGHPSMDLDPKTQRSILKRTGLK